MRPSITKPFMRSANAKYDEDMNVLKNMLMIVSKMLRVDSGICYAHSLIPVLEDRKAHPVDKNDVLNLMMSGVDKETEQKLFEQSIKYNVRVCLTRL